MLSLFLDWNFPFVFVTYNLHGRRLLLDRLHFQSILLIALTVAWICVLRMDFVCKIMFHAKRKHCVRLCRSVDIRKFKNEMENMKLLKVMRFGLFCTECKIVRNLAQDGICFGESDWLTMKSCFSSKFCRKRSIDSCTFIRDRAILVAGHWNVIVIYRFSCQKSITFFFFFFLCGSASRLPATIKIYFESKRTRKITVYAYSVCALRIINQYFVATPCLDILSFDFIDFSKWWWMEALCHNRD